MRKAKIAKDKENEEDKDSKGKQALVREKFQDMSHVPLFPHLGDSCGTVVIHSVWEVELFRKEELTSH